MNYFKLRKLFTNKAHNIQMKLRKLTFFNVRLDFF